MLKNLVSTIAKTLVDDPEAVKVSEIKSETACIIELRVGRFDVSKIVGKKGVTLQCIRTLTYKAGCNMGINATVNLIEDEKYT